MTQANLAEALKSAVKNALLYCQSLPVKPEEWIKKAHAALDSHSESAILECACQLHEDYFGLPSQDQHANQWLSDIQDAIWNYRLQIQVAPPSPSVETPLEPDLLLLPDRAHSLSVVTSPLLPVERLELEATKLPDLQERALGRAEALVLLLEQDCENLNPDFIVSSAASDSGDYSYSWNVDKLKEWLKVDDATFNLLGELDAINEDATAALMGLQMEHVHLKQVARDYVTLTKREGEAFLSPQALQCATQLIALCEDAPSHVEDWISTESHPLPSGRYIKAFHGVHQCEITGFIAVDGAYAGHFLEKTRTTAWPVNAFTHWMELNSPLIKESPVNAF